jgi:hypothetical protein
MASIRQLVEDIFSEGYSIRSGGTLIPAPGWSIVPGENGLVTIINRYSGTIEHYEEEADIREALLRLRDHVHARIENNVYTKC